MTASTMPEQGRIVRDRAGPGAREQVVGGRAVGEVTLQELAARRARDATLHDRVEQGRDPVGRRLAGGPVALRPVALAALACAPVTKFETSFAGRSGPAAEIASNAPVIPGSATSTAAS